MGVTNASIPFPDFKFNDVINPEQFDANNGELQYKINEILTLMTNKGFQDASPLYGSDMNILTNNGFYYANSSYNTPNNMNGYVFVQTVNSSYTSQIFIVPTNGSIYSRVKSNGVWDSQWTFIGGPAPAITPITLANSWVSYDGSVAHVWKDGSGSVRIYMFLKSGNAGFGVSMGNVPVGLRPPSAIYLPCVFSNGTTIGSGLVAVNGNGDVTVQSGIGNTWVLVCASYRT